MDSLQLKKRLLPLEHRILRTLKERGIQSRALLLAVSGGVDSIALLTILVRLQPLLKNEIVVVHVHHGRGRDVPPKQKSYRDRAQKFVKKIAKELGVQFFTTTYKGQKTLHSEAEYRDFRHQFFARVLKKWRRGSVLVTGHNADDLLETRLLRLLRGTGIIGLRAMDEKILRPLLSISRDEIVKYAKELNLRWIDDPSNESLDPQRNWLRHVWLPLLRTKWRGADRSLARSFDTILAELPGARVARKQKADRVISGRTISRPQYLALAQNEKTAFLAEYLLSLGVTDFSHGQLVEIVRQLDNPRGQFKFVAVRKRWNVTPQSIRATST